ncbi:MAG: riboflavin synthase [Bacteroidia bacterium]|nr:riboflavin synthase [Bacteroidia bacterium]
MFTGIVEAVGEIASVIEEGTNRIFRIAAVTSETLKVDQSIAHNGVCLTVTELYENVPGGSKSYSVTAVRETLEKTDLGSWRPGAKVNLERCLRAGDRLDGHFVQGHVDTVGKVRKINEVGGSWMVEIEFPEKFKGLLVDKGSICVNGVSLTVVESHADWFSVTIIPFTWEHTQFHTLKEGCPVNLEFDILGKYILKNFQSRD